MPTLCDTTSASSVGHYTGRVAGQVMRKLPHGYAVAPPPTSSSTLRWSCAAMGILLAACTGSIGSNAGGGSGSGTSGSTTGTGSTTTGAGTGTGSTGTGGM